jgi:hypothetical protein
VLYEKSGMLLTKLLYMYNEPWSVWWLPTGWTTEESEFESW